MHNKSPQTAVIFAGGKSSRMGRDKALLPFGGASSMAAFQYNKLRSLFDTVYLSTKTEKFDFDVPLIIDRYPQSSPMVALASLFETLEVDAVLILSVDMLMIDGTDIERICEHYRKNQPKPDVLVAQSPRGVEPLFGIYRNTILSNVQRLLKQDIHRMRALFERVKTEVLTFEKHENFANINTPEEYHAICPWESPDRL